MANKPPLEIHLIRAWRPLRKIVNGHLVVRIVERPVLIVGIGCPELEESLPGFMSRDQLRMIHFQHERLTKFDLRDSPLLFSTYRRIKSSRIRKNYFRFELTVRREISRKSKDSGSAFPRFKVEASARVFEDGEYRIFKRQDIDVNPADELVSLVLDVVPAEHTEASLVIEKALPEADFADISVRQSHISPEDSTPSYRGFKVIGVKEFAAEEHPTPLEGSFQVMYEALLAYWFSGRSSGVDDLLKPSVWQTAMRDYLNIKASNVLYQRFKAVNLATKPAGSGPVSIRRKLLQLNGTVYFKNIEHPVTEKVCGVELDLTFVPKERNPVSMEVFGLLGVINKMLGIRIMPCREVMATLDTRNQEGQFVWNGYRFRVASNAFVYQKLQQSQNGQLEPMGKITVRAMPHA